MSITLTELLIWFIIALIVGAIGEFIARRRTPGGILGAAVVGFIAIFLIVGVFNFSIRGEPTIQGVPLISSILAAALLVVIWSAVAFPRYYHYRRSTYAARPRRRRRWW